MKKIMKLILAAALALAVVAVMAGCGQKTLDYKVTVKDGLGNGIANVIVQFADADGNSKKFVTDKEGVVTYKEAANTDYTVTLMKGLSKAIIGASGESYTLKKDCNTLDAVLVNEETSSEIYGSVEEGTYAYRIGVGEHNAKATADMTYFVFNASVSGTYKFVASSDGSDANVGYYGGPMFVMAMNVTDSINNYDGKSFDIVIQDPKTPYVIGVESNGKTNVTLKAERIGDAPFDPEYAAWTEMLATVTMDKCALGNVTLTNLDITDSSLSITLGADGYYRTADGSLVYVRITSVSPYLDASLAMLAGFVSEQVGINIGGYIYDEDGNFVDKKRYNQMIETYMEYCDDSLGVCPLTEELADAIKLHGNSHGWWNPTSPYYLFTGFNVSKENAWMFLCCTVEE